MANVRLKVNMIIGGKNYPRDSVLDDQLVPERLRSKEYIASLEDKEGRVMALRDLHYQSLPRPSASGIPTSFPTFVAAGELIDLAQVPESGRASWKAGEDYLENFSHEEMVRLQKTREDIYADSESYQPPSGLMRRNR